MKKLLVILILSPLTLSAKPRLGKFFRPWWSETILQYDVFHSVGNYDANGNSQSLPSSNSFWETTNFDFAGRYVFSSNWAMTTGLNYVNAQTFITNISNTNGGIQTIHGGIEYKFDIDGFDLGVEGVGLFTPYSVDLNSTKPIYGDGAQAFGGNLWMQQRFDSFYWHAKAGYLYRSEGLSSLLPYELGLHWRLGSLAIGAIAEGAWSLTADVETDLTRTSFLNRSSAGSLHFRSANPNSNMLDLQAKWNVTNQFALVAGGGTTLMGKNSSHGNHVFLAVDILWQVFTNEVEPSPLKNIAPPPKPSKSHKSNKKEDKGPLFEEEDYQKQLKEQ